MRVIYDPPDRSAGKPQKPMASADDYRLGTIVKNDDSHIWRVEWDDQDKRHMWVQTALGFQ